MPRMSRIEPHNVGDSLGGLYRSITQRLADSGVDNPRLDARVLIRHFIGVDDADFIASLDTPIADLMGEAHIAFDAGYQALCKAVDRRKTHEPVSKILGIREFYGLEFFVNGDVLDPRADSETLIDAVLAMVDATEHAGQTLEHKAEAKHKHHFLRLKKHAYDAVPTYRNAPWRILDLGTGSGCLVVTLLSLLPNAHGVAVDVSPAALAVAKTNAERHKVADRLELLNGAWLAPVLPNLEQDSQQDSSLNAAKAAAPRPIFDIVISNPPYIPTADIESLMPEVRDHDPILALDGGEDGLDPYRIILQNIAQVIHPQSRIFFEFGTNQSSDIVRLVKDYGFALHDMRTDLGGINRVVSCALGAK